MTFPTWGELVDGVAIYVELSSCSPWNIETTIVRRCDDADEAIFPVIGRVRDRTRKVAESAIVYPGIRNRHTALGYSRQVLWALARLMGRVKAIFLQFDIEVGEVLDNFPNLVSDAHGSYSELLAAGVPLCMCYSAADGMECYAVDLGNNIVYIAEKGLLIATWQSDVHDLDDVQPAFPLNRQSWETWICQKHLVSLIPAWLWRAEWDSWCNTPDAMRIAATDYGHEPTVDAVEGAQKVPRDKGSGVITTAPGSQHPCRCPRPENVSIKYDHSSMEQLLALQNGEHKIPVVNHARFVLPASSWWTLVQVRILWVPTWQPGITTSLYALRHGLWNLLLLTRSMSTHPMESGCKLHIGMYQQTWCLWMTHHN